MLSGLVLEAVDRCRDTSLAGYKCFTGEGIDRHNRSISEQSAKFYHISNIFSDDRKREELNAIVHPAVREYVLQQKEAEERAGKLFLLVLEAALLIEEHYDEICDELWYIYTTEENRRARLKASRGYSDAHVDRIFASQLSEEEYRRHCRVVIDNNGTLEETLTQTEEALRREAYE